MAQSVQEFLTEIGLDGNCDRKNGLAKNKSTGRPRSWSPG
jgi:hypothetical protein